MRRKAGLAGLVLLGAFGLAEGVKLDKALLYDRHTLGDTYSYGAVGRCFQWEKIAAQLDALIAFENAAREFGALNNYRNCNGWAPVADSARQDPHYREINDRYGLRRNQSVPLYREGRPDILERYGRDGALVSVERDSAGYLWVRLPACEGEWMVPARYVDRLGGADFRKIILVDRTNQNAVTLEQGDSAWLIRSMNPVTTGVKRPPVHWETPLGIYVVRGKMEKMYYRQDGGRKIGGYAPWATRFSGGAYLHGVPVAYPDRTEYEYSWSLGTVPRSHMCVRNATSHAKFVYDWAPVDEALVIILD